MAIYNVATVYIIPSSTEELIMVPAEAMNTDDLLRINIAVTSEEVDPKIALESCIYSYSLADNKISIVATV